MLQAQLLVLQNLIFWQQRLWNQRHFGQRLDYECIKSSYVGRKDSCPDAPLAKPPLYYLSSAEKI